MFQGERGGPSCQKSPKPAINWTVIGNFCQAVRGMVEAPKLQWI